MPPRGKRKTTQYVLVNDEEQEITVELDDTPRTAQAGRYHSPPVDRSKKDAKPAAPGKPLQVG